MHPDRPTNNRRVRGSIAALCAVGPGITVSRNRPCVACIQRRRRNLSAIHRHNQRRLLVQCRLGRSLTRILRLTCPRISYPFLCEDRAPLTGFGTCRDRIRRSSDSGARSPRPCRRTDQHCRNRTRHQCRHAPLVGAPRSSQPERTARSHDNRIGAVVEGEQAALSSSRPRSKSSAPPRYCSGRTARPQKDSPGDRLPRRRWAFGESLLSTSRRQPLRLLHEQDPADVTVADAPSVVHWFDPRSPHGFATDLWVSTCACGTHARYGHRGQ